MPKLYRRRQSLQERSLAYARAPKLILAVCLCAHTENEDKATAGQLLTFTMVVIMPGVVQIMGSFGNK